MNNLLLLPEIFKNSSLSLVQIIKEIIQEKGSSLDLDYAYIKKEIRKNPSIIDAWIEYSENKRDSGWYIKIKENNFRVGFIEESFKSVREKEFLKREDACAFFVQMEVKRLLDIVKSYRQ